MFAVKNGIYSVNISYAGSLRRFWMYYKLWLEKVKSIYSVGLKELFFIILSFTIFLMRIQIIDVQVYPKGMRHISLYCVELQEVIFKYILPIESKNKIDYLSIAFRFLWIDIGLPNEQVGDI